jgi:hypothetical protein
MAATGTVLFQFQPRGIVLFVLLGRVIAILAIVTRQSCHQAIFFLCHYPITLVKFAKSAQRPQSASNLAHLAYWACLARFIQTLS